MDYDTRIAAIIRDWRFGRVFAGLGYPRYLAPRSTMAFLQEARPIAQPSDGLNTDTGGELMTSRDRERIEEFEKLITELLARGETRRAAVLRTIVNQLREDEILDRANDD